MELDLSIPFTSVMNEPEQPYTFVVIINDSYCTYEYTFKHNEEVSIHDIAKKIAEELKCEVPAGKFIDLSKS